MTINLCPARTDEEMNAAEMDPVPPLEGYPTDRALLYNRDGDVFVCIDRRDAELCVEYGEHVLILPAAITRALAQFLSAGTVRQALALAQA